MPQVKITDAAGLHQTSGKGTITYRSGLKGVVVPLFTSATALSAAGALTVNTLYHNSDTTTSAYTLPAAANCVAGDVICVKYIGIIGNGNTHKYGTSGEFFADTSLIFKSTNSANGVVYDHDVANGTSDDFLNIVGDTDASGGKGSVLMFVFNGTQWHVEGTLVGTGTGADAAVNAEFAAT